MTTPWRLWPLLGWTGILGELADLVAVRLSAYSPATRRCWSDADVAAYATAGACVCLCPTTERDLLRVPGIGPAKVDKYGTAILDLVRRHHP